MDPECKYFLKIISNYLRTQLTSPSYNGTSDIQLERVNVYFNEVHIHTYQGDKQI